MNLKESVLDILHSEARASSSEIARRLDVSEDDVKAVISDLEKTRTILGYRAVVDPEKLEHDFCLGIIEVKINPQRSKGYDAIAEHIHRFPEVRLCYLVSGNYDLLVFVEGPDLKAVSMFVTEKLAAVDHVVSTTTHFILKKYKEFGVVMGGDEKADRLAVAP